MEGMLYHNTGRDISLQNKGDSGMGLLTRPRDVAVVKARKTQKSRQTKSRLYTPS